MEYVKKKDNIKYFEDNRIEEFDEKDKKDLWKISILRLCFFKIYDEDKLDDEKYKKVFNTIVITRKNVIINHDFTINYGIFSIKFYLDYHLILEEWFKNGKFHKIGKYSSIQLIRNIDETMYDFNIQRYIIFDFNENGSTKKVIVYDIDNFFIKQILTFYKNKKIEKIYTIINGKFYKSKYLYVKIIAGYDYHNNLVYDNKETSPKYIHINRIL